MYGYAHATRQVQNLRVEGPVVAPLQRKNSHLKPHVKSTIVRQRSSRANHVKPLPRISRCNGCRCSMREP